MTRIVGSTVRRRIAALLLVAASPLLLVAAIIAWQNSKLVDDVTRRNVRAARTLVQTRQRAFLAEAERLLEAIALASAPLSSDRTRCAADLSRLVAVPGERYESLRVFDASGRMQCASAVSAASWSKGDMAAFDGARESGAFTIGGITPPEGAHPPVLPVALQMRPGSSVGQPPDIVLAAINESRLLRGPDVAPSGFDVRAWILPATGAAVALTPSDDDGLPDDAQLSRVAQAEDSMAVGMATTGERFIYALGTLPSGMRVLIAQATSASAGSADLVLGRRVVELGLVLMVGLALVAFGADRTIGRPLNRVARAVARWRAGGQFEPGPLDEAPAEIAELAHSFAAAAAALRVREEQLRAATAQQELLMQEIHHRVKNNLQIVASLLNLQAGRIRQPAAQAEFHAARDRIRALATLHRHLYAYGQLHTIDMRGFLEELCHQLMQAMGETPGGGRIALTIEASELRISSDQAVPIALLVTEAVSNAVKYAFPGGRSGHIAVRLTVNPNEAGDEVARLSIEDDGVGIPAGRAETDSGTRDGLGLQLIRGFSRQLGAKLEVIQDHGTHYIVEIVLQKERDIADAAGAGEVSVEPP